MIFIFEMEGKELIYPIDYHPFALFAVNKENILKYPKEVWRHRLNILLKWCNKDENSQTLDKSEYNQRGPWAIERFWHLLF